METLKISPIRAKFIHWGIRWFGDKDLRIEGTTRLPCRKCGKWFRSYAHYGEGGNVYDAFCEECTE